MSDPIVFISHFQIREGALDAYRQLQREVASDLEAAKRRTLVFLTYVDTAGSQMTAVHVFADAESMALHFEGSDERSAAAYEFLEPDGWEIYGKPSDQSPGHDAQRRRRVRGGVEGSRGARRGVPSRRSTQLRSQSPRR